MSEARGGDRRYVNLGKIGQFERSIRLAMRKNKMKVRAHHKWCSKCNASNICFSSKKPTQVERCKRCNVIVGHWGNWRSERRISGIRRCPDRQPTVVFHCEACVEKLERKRFSKRRDVMLGSTKRLTSRRRSPYSLI